MKLAVISDIHGNAIAFEAVLADLRRHPADTTICLGDCIQGGAQPAETVALLRALACPTVMGNADAYVLTGVEGPMARMPADRLKRFGEVREWSLAQLSPSDREFVASFTPTVSAEVGGRRLLGFHGSPDSFDEVILPDTPEAEVERMLAPHAVELMCGGHVHLVFQRTFRDSLHFNPGSVGQAYLHGALARDAKIESWAEYAVVDSDGPRLSVDFRRVPYDSVAYRRRLRDSGRPHADEMIAQYR